METGLWHVHYAQTHGLFGIQAIPRLAALVNIPPLNVPNFIAINYATDVLESASANTAYVYAYYSYFGMGSFIFSLISLWLLDLTLIVYRRISDLLLLAVVASISVTTMAFASTEYTIALITNGFLLLLFVSWIVDRFSHFYISRPYKSIPPPVRKENTL
jgi:hypothetical protein